MDDDTKTRAGGFLQGADWAAGAAAIGLIALHPVIVAGAVVATGAALATKKWRGQKTPHDGVDSSVDGTGKPVSTLPGLLDSVRARARERAKGSTA
jgi:hypothetical protein